MSGTTLVIGGTGTLGAPVVRALRNAGRRVRLLIRDPAKAQRLFGGSVEFVQGDLDDEDVVDRAISGSVAVHVSLAAGFNPSDIERVEHQGTARVARLAAERGVKRLTYLSGGHTSDVPLWDPPPDRYMTSVAKSRAEYAIRESGVPYTILRSTMFMEGLAMLAPGGRAIIFGETPDPYHLIAVNDFARMVVAALDNPAAAGKTLYPRGPEAIRLDEAFTIYKKLYDPKLKITRLPRWLLGIAKSVPFSPSVNELAKILTHFGREPEAGSPDECNELLGVATTTLAEWCRLGSSRAQRTT